MSDVARPMLPAVAVDGVPLRYQAVSPVRRELTNEQIAVKTVDNGFDEILLAMPDGEGGSKRLLLHGDHLDFGFRRQATPARVTVDDHPAQIIHFDDEERSFFEGAKAGFFRGYQDAFEALAHSTKRILSSLTIGSIVVLTGATTFAVTRANGAQTLLVALRAVAPPLLKSGAWVALGATILIGIAGAVSNGFKAAGRKQRAETLAAVIDEKADVRPPDIQVKKSDAAAASGARL